jgi:hypothetical protein
MSAMKADSQVNPYSSPIENAVVVSDLQRHPDWIGIDFELVPSDLEAFYLFHYFERPANRRILWIRWFLISCCLTLLGAAIVWYSMMPLLGIGVFGAGALFLLSYPILYRTRVRQIARTVVSNGRNLALKGLHRVRLSSRGILCDNAGGEHLYYWDTVEGIHELKNHILIYVSGFSALIVPKRAFSIEDDYREFLATAQQKAGPNAGS